MKTNKKSRKQENKYEQNWPLGFWQKIKMQGQGHN